MCCVLPPQAGEDAQLAQPVSIDLQELLPRITSHQELTLTGAQFKAAQSPPRAWPAGPSILQQQQPGAAGDGASVSWSQAWLQQQCSASTHSRHPDAAASSAASSSGPPFNIWDHRQGDAGSVVELFPQEIRTFLVTLEP
jgi:hypothetical protein